MIQKTYFSRYLLLKERMNNSELTITEVILIAVVVLGIIAIAGILSQQIKCEDFASKTDCETSYSPSH